jgi:hypothetical protein
LCFRYTKQVLSGSLAVLELETIVDGKYVNGVDIIRCDESGQIVELREGPCQDVGGLGHPSAAAVGQPRPSHAPAVACGGDGPRAHGGGARLAQLILRFLGSPVESRCPPPAVLGGVVRRARLADRQPREAIERCCERRLWGEHG